jgi:hypothetical protein
VRWLISHFFDECRQFVDIALRNGFFIRRLRNYLKIPVYRGFTFNEQLVQINTQKLLGHKTMKMADSYNYDRGKEWIVVGKKVV